MPRAIKSLDSAESARSRAWVIMGAKPPYPLTMIMEECGESLCGGQRLCEHVPSGKMAAGGACKNNRLCRPAIRAGPFLNMGFHPIPPHYS